jgi:hypothetical protein
MLHRIYPIVYYLFDLLVAKYPYRGGRRLARISRSRNDVAKLRSNIVLAQNICSGIWLRVLCRKTGIVAGKLKNALHLKRD